MPYFQACVCETLRLRPPTPIILPRSVPADGITLDGHYVPPRTDIGANPWIIHRNEAIFGQNVDTFRPERWLEDPVHARQMTKYDLTWGFGSRRCVGKNVALLDGSKPVAQVRVRLCSALP